VRKPDVAAATAVLALAALALYEAGRLPFGTARNPGPGFLPWWTSLALGGLALGLLGQAFRASPSPGPARGGGARVAGLLAVLAGYVLVLETLGYPASTFLLVLFMLRVVEPYRWPVALGVAGFAAAGSYLVFAVWLKVPLPPVPPWIWPTLNVPGPSSGCGWSANSACIRSISATTWAAP
jgi:putative tricarboxylic transport membrane protein